MSTMTNANPPLYSALNENRSFVQQKNSGSHFNRSIADTAYWTAAVRAQEHARPDRLFADPWAAALAGDTGMAWIAQRRPESVVPIVLRTRFFDNFLHQLATAQGIRQFVLLAAGLDTRAFRLSWPPGVTIFEVDQPTILAAKEQVLQAHGATPTCVRHTVAADLTAAWQPALIQAGFAPEQPTGWLLEGVLFYLTTSVLTALLTQLLQWAAPGSYLGFDIINGLTLTSPLTKGWVEMQAAAGAPWVGALDDPVAFLAAQQWQATLTTPGAPEANFGRWTLPVIPTTMPGMPHLWYVTAEKGSAG